MNNNFAQMVLSRFMNRAGQNLTPTQQDYINTIQSGDSSRGEQLAMNLCKSMGVSREEAIAQARQFFHI